MLFTWDLQEFFPETGFTIPRLGEKNHIVNGELFLRFFRNVTTNIIGLKSGYFASMVWQDGTKKNLLNRPLALLCAGYKRV